MSIVRHSDQQEEPIVFSADGFVRMTLRRFCALAFGKRETFVDDDLLRDLQDQDVPADKAGFCEWADDSRGVTIYFGWAWFALAEHASSGLGEVMLAPGAISTNVIFLTADGRDVGRARTVDVLASWLSGRPWQDDVRRVVVPQATPRPH